MDLPGICRGSAVDLPGGAIEAPMTYMVDGKQDVALTVGGGSVPELIALALPCLPCMKDPSGNVAPHPPDPSEPRGLARYPRRART